MLLLTGIGCLAAGLLIGYIMAGRASASPKKIIELEQKLQDSQRSYAQYRDEVGEHFSTTAELVQQMTDSYKDVYQHLASGAQELCSGDVASKLLPTSNSEVFNAVQHDDSDDNDLQAPKDYAPRQDPSQSGALAEDFGLDKTKVPESKTSDKEASALDKESEPDSEASTPAIEPESDQETNTAELEPESDKETSTSGAESEPELESDKETNTAEPEPDNATSTAEIEPESDKEASTLDKESDKKKDPSDKE